MVLACAFHGSPYASDRGHSTRIQEPVLGKKGRIPALCRFDPERDQHDAARPETCTGPPTHSVAAAVVRAEPAPDDLRTSAHFVARGIAIYG
jgi:hypothetical protein